MHLPRGYFTFTCKEDNRAGSWTAHFVHGGLRVEMVCCQGHMAVVVVGELPGFLLL